MSNKTKTRDRNSKHQRAAQAGADEAKRTPPPVDVSPEGIPDQAQPPSIWRLVLVLSLFAAWIAILLVGLLTGTPGGAS